MLWCHRKHSVKTLYIAHSPLPWGQVSFPNASPFPVFTRTSFTRTSLSGIHRPSAHAWIPAKKHAGMTCVRRVYQMFTMTPQHEVIHVIYCQSLSKCVILLNLFTSKWACRVGSGIRYPQQVFKAIRIANVKFILWPGDTKIGFVFFFVLRTAPTTLFP